MKWNVHLNHRHILCNKRMKEMHLPVNIRIYMDPPTQKWYSLTFKIIHIYNLYMLNTMEPKHSIFGVSVWYLNELVPKRTDRCLNGLVPKRTSFIIIVIIWLYSFQHKVIIKHCKYIYRYNVQCMSISDNTWTHFHVYIFCEKYDILFSPLLTFKWSDIMHEINS